MEVDTVDSAFTFAIVLLLVPSPEVLGMYWIPGITFGVKVSVVTQTDEICTEFEIAPSTHQRPKLP
jgi:hypothetical protein